MVQSLTDEPLAWHTMHTPIGAVSVAATGRAVRAVRFGTVAQARPTGTDFDLLGEVLDQLRGFFAGSRTDFDVPLAAQVGSPFERAVWSQLREIPYGQMRTYGDVARALGQAGAARAVGVACNRNPLPLLVPCHRVVGAGGKLVGFGGGLAAKRWLLEHEATVAWQRAWS